MVIRCWFLIALCAASVVLSACSNASLEISTSSSVDVGATTSPNSQVEQAELEGVDATKYGPPEWFPLRTSANGEDIRIGCTYHSSGGPFFECKSDSYPEGYHPVWALDLGAEIGSTVFAAGRGFATPYSSGSRCEDKSSMYGNAVVVDHGPFGKTIYAHLSEISKEITEEGIWVDENSQLGLVGNTGNSDCSFPHLHFEVFKGRPWVSAIDPGSLKACHGWKLVTYPEALEAHPQAPDTYSNASKIESWEGMPWGVYTARGDGTACHSVDTSVQVDSRAAIEADGEFLWVADTGTGGAVHKLDTDTDQVVASIPVEFPSSIAVGFGSVWVASSPHEDTTLFRIDLETAEVTGQTRLDAFGPALAIGAGSVWVSDGSGRKVLRVDPSTLEVTATISVGWPSAIAFGGDTLWVANHHDVTVSQVDPATNTVTGTIELDIGPRNCCTTAQGIAYGAGSVWVAVADRPGEGYVVRIDPNSMSQTALVEIGRVQGAGFHNDVIDVSASTVWVVNRYDETLSRIDVSTNMVTATVPVDSEPEAIEVTEVAVWAGSRTALVRLDRP